MELTLYKPNKSGKGGAIKFNIHNSGKFSFMKAAPQIADMGSERVFGWEDDKSINVKMTSTDLAAMLSVIRLMNENVKLFHKTPSDNKVIEFTHVPDRNGFSLKVSQKVEGNSQANSVFIGVSYAEAIEFALYAEAVIRENHRNAGRRD